MYARYFKLYGREYFVEKVLDYFRELEGTFEHNTPKYIG